MQLKYGTFPFDANSLWIAVNSNFMRNAAGRPYAQMISMDVHGWLSASGQSALTTAITNLQNALNVPYQDLIFYEDAGSKSAHLLTQATSISGVVVTSGPRFGATRGAEYAVQREFWFTAEADYALPNTANILIDFNETLILMGGAPLYVCREAVNGIPDRALIYPSTVYSAVQTGRALGFKKYPTPMLPIFPDALRGGRDGTKIGFDNPKRRGNNYVEYPTSWEYRFESPRPLIGVPNIWRG